MKMKEIVSKDMFFERFKDYGRNDQFSGAGLEEDDIGEGMELDVKFNEGYIVQVF
jgi:hypothetical protein